MIAVRDRALKPIGAGSKEWELGDYRIELTDFTDSGFAAADGVWAFGRASIADPTDLSGHSVLRGSPAITALLQGFARDGFPAIARATGPFILVVVNPAQRFVAVARDPIGVSAVYFSDGPQIEVADSLDCFDHCEAIDLEYVADFIGRGYSGSHTVRPSIKPVPPGHAVCWEDGKRTVVQYWNPLDLHPARGDDQELAEEFRAALVSAVARSTVGGGVWAHLSGGLDSSTVVSVGSAALPRIDGTITFADSLGNADETRFSDPVVTRYNLRNVLICDDWPWRSDGDLPPITDHPTRNYAYYARDRRVSKTILEAGGTTLLTGVGPDYYLPVSADHVPDLFWNGQLREALDELQRWTVSTGQTYRQTVPELVLSVVAPKTVLSFTDRVVIPGWIRASFAKQARMPERWSRWCSGKYVRGRRSALATAASLKAMAASLIGWSWTPGVSVRHPLLDKALVELAIRLPYQLRSDTYWSKPILRAAIEGIVPESVRARRDKAIVEPRICWAFEHEHRRIQKLISNSILADLGVIEPSVLQESIEALRRGRPAAEPLLHLFSVLSLETWLSARSGRCVDVS